MGVSVPGAGPVRAPASRDVSLRFAPRAVVIAHQEAEGRKRASEHGEATGLRDLDAVRAEIAAEDSEHAATFAALLSEMGTGAGARKSAAGSLERLLQKETWHNQGGGWISGAIYGVNDGLAE